MLRKDMEACLEAIKVDNHRFSWCQVRTARAAPNPAMLYSFYYLPLR